MLIVAFLGGVLTLLSPCILPVLPLLLQRAGGPAQARRDFRQRLDHAGLVVGGHHRHQGVTFARQGRGQSGNVYHAIRRHRQDGQGQFRHVLGHAAGGGQHAGMFDARHQQAGDRRAGVA